MVSAAEEPVVRLANDVGVQFSYLDADEQPVAVASHFQRFWDPRMLTRLAEVYDAGGAGLEPVALAAARIVTADLGEPGEAEQDSVAAEPTADNPAAEVG